MENNEFVFENSNSFLQTQTFSDTECQMSPSAIDNSISILLFPTWCLRHTDRSLRSRLYAHFNIAQHTESSHMCSVYDIPSLLIQQYCIYIFYMLKNISVTGLGRVCTHYAPGKAEKLNNKALCTSKYAYIIL